MVMVARQWSRAELVNHETGKILQICKQKRLQNSAIRVISLCRKENVITKNLVFWRP